MAFMSNGDFVRSEAKIMPALSLSHEGNVSKRSEAATAVCMSWTS